MESIWKDKYISLGTADSVIFRIKVGDDEIYRGKANKRPGETNNTIKINEVCADYLQNTLPYLSASHFTDFTAPTFTIQKSSGTTWSDVASVQFINDWSYDRGYNPATMGMSFPITGRVDSRQWITYTAYNASQVNAVVRFADGTSINVIIPVAISNDFNADFNNDFSRSVRSAGSGTAVFDLSQWAGVTSITIGGTTYKVTTDCKRYALYYANAYGGWDTLLIEGNHKEFDNLERYTRETEYDNRDVVNRGRYNFVNEITKGFTLNTGWLTDAEADKMHHLINSTNVYLYDINTGEMIPAILTDNTCEYKTYKSEGNKLVNYSLQLELANIRTRR